MDKNIRSFKLQLLRIRILRTTDVNNLVKGVYKFQLRVTDNNGATGTDIIQITVNAATNQPPVANAGPDQVDNFAY